MDILYQGGAGEVNQGREWESSDRSLHNMDELPFAVIVRNVAEKLMIKSAEKHVKFSIDADDNIKILGNGDQMVQLVLILSDNALKYSPENSIISLGAKKLEDGSVLFSVKDEAAHYHTSQTTQQTVATVL